VANCYVAKCYVASCVVANCVVANCVVANCMGIDFRPPRPKAPDTRVKAFLKMASNLRSKSTKLVAQHCHGYRCDMHSGVIDTAVT
jgi:hypothetical protein